MSWQGWAIVYLWLIGGWLIFVTVRKSCRRPSQGLAELSILVWPLVPFWAVGCLLWQLYLLARGR